MVIGNQLALSIYISIYRYFFSSKVHYQIYKKSEFYIFNPSSNRDIAIHIMLYRI